MTNLLSPYRVLDLAGENGVFCGKVLADLGADVIKIERPGGDPSRNTGRFYHDDPDPEKNLDWFAFNTGKRSVTLNLEAGEGQEILKKLTITADLVVESFAPGYMRELGLDFPALGQVNPWLVMCSITPFGQSGPYRDFQVSDIVTLALSGFMTQCGDPDRAPLRCSVEQAHIMAGLQAAAGSLIALHHARATGQGQYVDVSMYESAVWFQYSLVPFWDIAGTRLSREGPRASRGNATFRLIWPCRDGYINWRVLAGPMGKTMYALVDWMDEEGMAGDLRSVNWTMDMNAVTQEQVYAWEEGFGAFFLAHTKDELLEESVKRGIMLTPASTIEDLLRNRQLEARDFWIDIEHPELGALMRYPGIPFKSTQEVEATTRRAPRIGEHNRDIYMRELGLSRDEMARLERDGVI